MKLNHSGQIKLGKSARIALYKHYYYPWLICFLLFFYRIKFVKSDNKIPNVELEEMGPALDLNLRRSKLGSDDLYKKSKKQPKEIVVS